MTRNPSPHTRWFVAALMVIVVPWCCCSGRIVSETLSGTAASLVAGQGAETDGCCPSGSKDESAPCDDERSCGCDQHKQIRNRADGPATIDLSATFTALVPSIFSTSPAPEPVAIRVSAEAIPRPPTSLLRLHCALIV